MTIHQTCDGVKRRDFLKAGVLGTAGLSLAGYLRLAAGRRLASTGKARNAIFINLTGGPSHMDTFDLKPNAPAEYRGQFNPIKTNVAGRRDQRAPAEAGRSAPTSSRSLPRRHPHARRSRAGHRVRQHRQPADSVAANIPATARS